MKYSFNRGTPMLALALVLFIGIATAVRADDMDRKREKAAELAVRIRDAQYSTVGMGNKPEFDRAHRDYAYLLGPKKLAEVEGLVAKAPNPAEKALREKTLRFLQDRTVWSKIAPTLDNYLEYARTASIQAGDAKVTLRGFWQLLSQTPDRTARRINYLATGEMVSNANVYLLNIEIDLQKASEELGLGNYYDFLAEREGWNTEVMDALAAQILEETQAEYKALLEKMATEVVEQELRRVRAYDVPVLIAQARYDDSFPPEKLEDLAKKTLSSIGINLDDQRYLRFDFKEREGKDPSPHCFGVENERNTRITMVADGGLDDYRGLLKCLGESQFYYHIDGGLPFEQRYLSNPILPMVFGELMAHLMEQPAWLKGHISSVSEAEYPEIAEALRFLRLYELREDAGKYLFQRRFQNDLKVTGKDYTEQMELATLIPQTGNEEAFYLLSNDRFRSGGRLVAAVLEIHLRKKMIEQLGEEWFNNKKAGSYLMSIASKGYSRSPEDWAGEWGVPGVDPVLLLAELNNGGAPN